jgi:hypothetical protein
MPQQRKLKTKPTKRHCGRGLLGVRTPVCVCVCPGEKTGFFSLFVCMFSVSTAYRYH